jgi:hypothetical protein
MHRMSNLNKFKDSYQVFEKNLGLCFIRKKGSRTHKERLNNFFLPKMFITNTLCAKVYLMYECDKNKMPYYNVKNLKKSNF